MRQATENKPFIPELPSRPDAAPKKIPRSPNDSAKMLADQVNFSEKYVASLENTYRAAQDKIESLARADMQEHSSTGEDLQDLHAETIAPLQRILDEYRKRDVLFNNAGVGVNDSRRVGLAHNQQLVEGVLTRAMNEAHADRVRHSLRVISAEQKQKAKQDKDDAEVIAKIDAMPSAPKKVDQPPVAEENLDEYGEKIPTTSQKADAAWTKLQNQKKSAAEDAAVLAKIDTFKTEVRTQESYDAEWTGVQQEMKKIAAQFKGVPANRLNYDALGYMHLNTDGISENNARLMSNALNKYNELVAKQTELADKVVGGKPLTREKGATRESMQRAGINNIDRQIVGNMRANPMEADKADERNAYEKVGAQIKSAQEEITQLASEFPLKDAIGKNIEFTKDGLHLQLKGVMARLNPFKNKQLGVALQLYNQAVDSEMNLTVKRDSMKGTYEPSEAPLRTRDANMAQKRNERSAQTRGQFGKFGSGSGGVSSHF